MRTRTHSELLGKLAISLISRDDIWLIRVDVLWKY
jgi:hypothetical protein